MIPNDDNGFNNDDNDDDDYGDIDANDANNIDNAKLDNADNDDRDDVIMMIAIAAKVAFGNALGCCIDELPLSSLCVCGAGHEGSKSTWWRLRLVSDYVAGQFLTSPVHHSTQIPMTN